MLYAAAGDVRTYDRRTGQLLWHSSAVAGGRIGDIHWQSPMVANGQAMMPDMNRTGTAFSAR